MGCDGGTIPKRHELVRTKQKAETAERQVELDSKWKYCALSNQLLTDPIVACELGSVYNKDAVIEYLLDKKSDNKVEKMKHIKGLKDLHTLTLTKNPSWLNKSENGDGYIDTNAAKFICPVAGIEMNGRYSFCFLRTCNCVLSERALKQVRDSLCPVCCKEYSKNEDVIPINGTEEQRKELYEKLTKRKDLKLKSKKKKEDKTKDKITTKSTLSDKASTSGIVSENVRNLSSANTVLGAKHKLQDEKIFQTQTFKSLFTSHSSAKRAKDKNGHWITYNPYHYAG